MAHLDLDTTALAAGGARARAAVSALAASPVVGGTDDASTLAVAGDPVLAGALVDLAAAWAATRTALTDDLDALAGALSAASEIFEQAEQVAAGRLGELLAPAGGGGA
ncbi:hypothetical protein ABE437_15960 [Isoptericola cucumis]|uniref:hypothetical protein n=1 Tax=Isoptericola cucumis TaxID=1776856 RepID=UPI003209C70D